MTIPDLIALASSLVSVGAAYGSLRGRIDSLERAVALLNTHLGKLHARNLHPR